MTNEIAPNEELIARCLKTECLQVFHLQPANMNNVQLFNEILADNYARGPVWMDIKCPVCEHTFRALGSVLEHCSCGLQIHPKQ
jgi:hypothetical protein